MRQSFNVNLLLAILIIAGIGLSPVQAKPLDQIAAVVGEDVILESELAAAVAELRARVGARADQVPRDALRSQVLDQIIMTRLQLARAERAGLTVSDAELDRGVARIARQNGMDVAQFKQALRARGISPQALRERVREDMLIGKLRQQEVMSEVVVTEDDVTQFLESQSLRIDNNRELHIRHILIEVSAGADEQAVKQARERIEQIRAQAVSGEATFADLAVAHSDGENALKGGDLGWIGGAFMPVLFTDIVPDMAVGDISRVFRGAGGFHLVKLVDTRGTENLAGGEKVMVEEVRARHIELVPNALRNDARTRELATELRERLAAGADFADLAREYSDDTATASQGGDLGWVRPRRFGPGIARQLRTLAPGGISPILKTRDGYEIVKVVDRRRRDQTREAIRSRARQVLGQRKAQEKGQRWLRKLRDEAYIDIRMEGYRRSGG